MAMPSHVVLYVDNPGASADFYSAVLEEMPVSASASFVLFEQDEGLRLGLWSRECVEPAATIAGGGAELVVVVEDEDAVDRRYEALSQRGLCIIQPPQDMEYGRSFVLLDPDGHRVRLMMPF
ncbi:MAG: VOC family protein [Paludibacterium sp.]|uniref:VOC family protein n=1 Tax=Paludibacterium sp. TaxID=1917523 RepID=UPI0025CCF931|nr:VOC family protein [Paludibacterium sp.]MBV8048444.1 VOC family protein [Paludibacterium sp.]MBV8647139.1 VOC family protein [Paludibacterium sp.]